MARRKRNQEVEKDNAERWLLTYADLITLLMIFFVVLYSISQVDANKFRAIADSLNNALGGGTPAKVEINNTFSGPSLLATGTPKENSTSAANKDKKKGKDGNNEQENLSIMGIKAKLDKFAQDNGIQAKIISSIEERGLVISIQETILFASGSAEVTPHAREVLNKISVVLSPVPNYIRVEGHTDNIPIHTLQFQSNWELSVLRATNVLHILTKEGNIAHTRLSAAGYGEFRPIASNSKTSGRELNRRVDLVILRSKYDITEPGSQP